MGAICGIIRMDGNSIPLGMKLDMIEELKLYPIDNSGTWEKDKVFLGSVIKYITPEDKEDRLTCFHSEHGLVVIADAILDNREELLTMFNISEDEHNNIPNSEIILMAYLKWGEKCPRYLLGDFTFAIWNERRKELYCARDQVGKRTFYYVHSKGFFAFCTVIKPLLKIKGTSIELNDSWIADYLSLDSLVHEIDCSKTVYKDIMQLLPAHTLKFNLNQLEMKRYWNPLDTPKLKLKNNAEYEEAFREVFSKAVNCRLRSIDSVGVMLSGGLDSSSVACTAAIELEKEGKRLKAFTSVPFSGYKNWLPSSMVADEREYIQSILTQYNNIDITYCDCERLNGVNNIDQLINIIEQPYKIVGNFFWINEIASKARESNCSILLDGQFGNYTISFGDIKSYLMSLYRRGRVLSLLREINCFCQLQNMKYKEVLKYFISLITPEFAKVIYHYLSGNERIKSESLALINPEFAIKYDMNKKLKKMHMGPFEKSNEDIYDIRKSINNYMLFSQCGTAETKISLEHGIAKRDPTRDKRVIEFCMSLPINQYVNNGEERSLVRRAMVGILPDKIRLNQYVRGKQSADFVQRLVPEWNNIRLDLEHRMQKDYMRKYINTSKVLETIDSIDSSPQSEQYYKVQMIIVALVFGRFMDEAIC